MKKILFLLLLLSVFSAHARTGLLEGLGIEQTTDTPPLVEDAFQFDATIETATTLMAQWQVMEGNYLYRDKIRFEILDNDQVKLAEVTLPAGENKNDEIFGLVEVYHHDVMMPLTLQRPASAQKLTVKAFFQGCSETFGICYPPSAQQVSLNLPVASETVANTSSNTEPTPTAQTPVAEQDRIAQKLAEDNLLQIFFGFLGLGLLLAFTPCVFPMIPILSSIIVGEGENITTRRAFTLSLVYVLAMSVTYTAAGILTGLLGENLQSMFQNPWVIVSFSGLFVVLSLSMFGLYELQLPHAVQHRLHRISHKQQSGSLIGVAIMGLLSGLIVGPCLAPPLAGALIFLGQHADPFLGGMALFALSIGMGIPLLIIGTSAGKLLPRAGDWMNVIKAIFGVLLIGLAIWMLERILPGWITLFLWGSLLVISAIYMGALNSLAIDANGTEKLFKGAGLILMLYGALLIVGGASGSHNVWQPLQAVNLAKGQLPSQVTGLKFTQIDNLQQLETQLATTNQPVMLDFYADWCTDCKTMEQTTFRDPDVVAAMDNYTLLQLDMTDNTQAHQDLLKALQVFGPPTMLFYDNTGEELRQQRLVGHIKPQQMLTHLSQLN
ncbi:protein-disulfide reductase DsbD [Methylophaga thiooxydans]|uniref:protein-disulfide reductase DsbD n=1 Tax=Methylophaga thiooxydans TaxID=392484 RepID=UPI002352BB76|nr:protein-disulfide reductase DsbD [Methylophaga thiooxydans]